MMQNSVNKLTSATLGISNWPGSPNVKLGGIIAPDPMARSSLRRSNFDDPMSRISCPMAREEPNMVVVYLFIRYKECFLLNKIYHCHDVEGSEKKKAEAQKRGEALLTVTVPFRGHNIDMDTVKD